MASDELLRAALLGTSQAGEHHAEPAVDAIVPATTRERGLLLRAGASALYRRAGRLPLPAPARTAVSPADSLSIPLAGLCTLLAELFVDGSPILPEALTLLAGAKRRLPPELLPAALEQRDGEIRALLRPVLGERGRWLAARQEAWRWALAPAEPRLPDDADRRWDEGRADERRRLLTLAHREDPPRARRWLAADFAGEKAEQRQQLVEALGPSLSAEDADFLTAALADRSAGVRQAAARLLWRLPGPLAGRMRERADQLLVSLDDLRLPPEKLPVAWSKDGIDEKPPHGVGRRQWWLAQLVAAVPVAHWARLGSPATILEAVGRHELADAWIDGFTASVLRHGGVDWLEPLWAAWATRDESWLVDEPHDGLLAAMPAEMAIRAALSLFQPGANPSPLSVLPMPWPAPLAEAFFASLSRPIDRSQLAQRVWLIRLAALALPAAALDRALPALPGLEEYHQVVDRRRRLHHEMHKETNREPT